MRERRTMGGGVPTLLAVLALCAAGSVWLLSHAVVRDIRHPAYSTLNDSPRGTRLLYEALSQMPLDVRRRYTADAVPTGATLFRIGLSSEALERLPATSEETAFVLSGGRLVCAFEGVRTKPMTNGYAGCCGPSGCGPVAGTNRPAAEVEAPSLTRGVTWRLADRWTEGARAVAVSNGVPWYSRAFFELSEGATNRWRTLYAVDGRPVLIESRMGKGSLVLATDCYFLSNEGLVKDRRPALLAGLVGGARTVVFDETIHGLLERRNLAWLFRRYRLGGVLAAVSLVVLLTLWQQACPLLPRAGEPETVAVDPGFRLGDGLVNLLRQHVPDARLPRCLMEAWLQTEPSVDDETRAAMRRAVEHGESGRAPPAETCRELYRLKKGVGIKRSRE